MRRWSIAMSLGLTLSACIAAPSPIDEEVSEDLEPREAVHVSIARPLLAIPRPTTSEGCTWLDPKPDGPRTSHGPIFETIAHDLAYRDPAAPKLKWIQPAVPPASIDGMEFYAANARGKLRWCYIDPDNPDLSAQCDGRPDSHWLLPPYLEPPYVPEEFAGVIAMLDHAVRVYDTAEQAERCTPAPASVLATITAPAWRMRHKRPGLEFVEHVLPQPTLARLVHVRVEREGTTRTELWSWNPKKPR